MYIIGRRSACKAVDSGERRNSAGLMIVAPLFVGAEMYTPLSSQETN